MTDNLPALLPCPFCGGAPKTLERPDNIDGTEFVYAVSCYCDGYSARAHQLARCKTPEQAKATATSAWNRRAALAQAQSLPAGWKLVPVDPTNAMLRAMSSSKATDEEGEFPSMFDLIDYSGENKTRAVMLAAYRAILAASPAQTVQPSEASRADVQWQKRHPLRTEGAWENTHEHDAKWWRDNSQGWEIRALYAAPVTQAKPEHAAQQWMPIETAPKDKTVLLYGAKRLEMCAGMNHSRDGWVTDTTSEWTSMYPPSHWMPLPAAPQPKD